MSGSSCLFVRPSVCVFVCMLTFIESIPAKERFPGISQFWHHFKTHLVASTIDFFTPLVTLSFLSSRFQPYYYYFLPNKSFFLSFFLCVSKMHETHSPISDLAHTGNRT